MVAILRLMSLRYCNIFKIMYIQIEHVQYKKVMFHMSDKTYISVIVVIFPIVISHFVLSKLGYFLYICEHFPSAQQHSPRYRGYSL